MKRLFIGAAVAVLVGGLATRASADPVLITGGNFTINAFSGPTSFNFTLADGTSVAGTWPIDLSTVQVLGACTFCPPGTLVSPAATFSATPPAGFREPFPTVNGTVASGELRFTGSSFTLPSSDVPLNDTTLLSFLQPFKLSGTITGYSGAFTRDPQPLFTIDFTGFGTARMNFIATGTDAGAFYDFHSTSYDFAPVPEPASLLLLGTGLAAAALRARRPTRAC